MTLATTGSRFSYDGDASTTAFSFPRKVIEASHLKVYLYDKNDDSMSLQTLNTHYTFAGSGLSNGIYASATITFLSAPGTDKKVVIFRDPPLTNEFDFTSETNVLNALNRLSDRMEMKIQRLDDRLDRAILLPDGDYQATLTNTYPRADWASKVLGFDSGGSPVPYTPSDAGAVIPDDVSENTVTATSGSTDTTLAAWFAAGSYQAETLAALKATDTALGMQAVVVRARTTAGDGGGGVFVWRSGDQSANITADPSSGVWAAPDSDSDGSSGAWMRLWDGISDGGGLNPKWFGAKGDDSTVDSTAFSATNAYAAAVGASIRIPPGTYIIGNFQPSAGARLVGAGMGKTILKRAGSSADNNSIIAVTANNVAIEDLTLDGNKANQTLGANNIHVTACGALAMRRIKSINAKLVAGGYGAGLSFYNSDDDDDDTFSEISGGT